MSTPTLKQALTMLGKSDLAKVAGEGFPEYNFTSRDATTVSFITALVKNASSQELDKCEQYARFWGVLDECRTYKAKLAEYKAPELADGDYAICQKVGHVKIRKYAAYDSESTVKAAIGFYESRNRYPYDWRKEASTKLLAKSIKFSAHLPEYVDQYLHKAAGFGLASEESVQKIWMERAHMADGTKLAEAMIQVQGDPELRYDPQFIGNLIRKVASWDEETCNQFEYGTRMSLPEELIDSELTVPHLEKLSSYVNQHAKLVNGKTIDATLLSKEALAVIDPRLAKMGQEELVAVLPTLPKEDADLLVRLS